MTGRRRWAAVALMAVGAAALAGCGASGPKLIPVSGKVTLDGKPAKEGGVMFISASNSMSQLVGSIQPDGTYSIITQREPGAPAGEYRVTVLVTETKKDASGNYTGLPRTLSNKQYSNPNTTPLKIEVQEGAPEGAYDLAVTS
jgi:predicted small lipoprotein YifL